MSHPSVVIVSPALAAANNGNWRTARRWQQFLAPDVRARIVQRWPDADAAGDTVMLALHARRSAEAIHAWAGTRGRRGLAVVLTGTDLYQDLAVDARARRSVELAQRLVVLQDRASAALAPHLRDKARVIFQSAPSAPALPKRGDVLTAVMVGHLRAAKSPQTLFAAARLLRNERDIAIVHIGEAGDGDDLGEQARATMRDCPSYTWAGPLPHDETLRRIAQAHVLVHTSALEGGAHVILEAVRCGTPVLASRVDGNVGMLGEDFHGYFMHGDAEALAGLLRTCRSGQQDPAGGLLARLAAQCTLRAPLFEPEAERAALRNLLQELHPPS